jgi:hypothetical protein
VIRILHLHEPDGIGVGIGVAGGGPFKKNIIVVVLFELFYRGEDLMRVLKKFCFKMGLGIVGEEIDLTSYVMQASASL